MTGRLKEHGQCDGTKYCSVIRYNNVWRVLSRFAPLPDMEPRFCKTAVVLYFGKKRKRATPRDVPSGCCILNTSIEVPRVLFPADNVTFQLDGVFDNTDGWMSQAAFLRRFRPCIRQRHAFVRPARSWFLADENYRQHTSTHRQRHTRVAPKPG